MIVPEHWAEARRQHKVRGRQVTVRRFGWSDDSLALAQAMADERADDALRLAVADDKVPRREPRVAYNGAQGVPIREEVLARHGDVVITRNSYGAKCLNTPDVLFADIDFSAHASLKSKWALFLLAVLVGVAAAWWLNSRMAGLVLAAVVALAAGPLADRTRRAALAATGGPEAWARRRMQKFLAAHPAWHLRLYRTPAGLRVLATHQPCSPADSDVQAFFSAVQADPLYVRMCRNQHCFRARLTAKPWRMKMPKHIKPRPGVWPVAPERQAERTLWLAEYELRAERFAACRFIGEMGSGRVHPRAAAVVELHDTECRAQAGNLALA